MNAASMTAGAGGDAALIDPVQGTRPNHAKPSRSVPSGPDVAVLVYDLRVSGVVINALRIVEAIQDRGLIAELWVVNREGALADRLPPRVQVRHLQSSSWLPRSAAGLAAIPGLARMLRRHRPGVLLSAGNHVHAPAVIARRLAGLPNTMLIGRASNALAAAAPPKRPGRVGRLLRAAAIKWERIQYGAMDAVVAVSRELADQLVEHGGVTPAAIAVIPNGVDLAAIEEQCREPLDHHWFADDARPVIVAAGRLSRQKNFTQLLKAFALMRRTASARLVILGSGPEQERQKLLRLARELGIARDLWLAGYQPNPFKFFARARLFAMTSRWEGCSNVLIEALACGLPVVVTDHPGGPRELLDRHEAGRIVPVDDVEATAHAMLEMLVRRHRPEISRDAVADHKLAHCLSLYDALVRSAIASPTADEWNPASPGRRATS